MLASCTALLLSFGTAGAAETGTPRSAELETPEEIQVLGRRGRLMLRAEIVRIEARMFNLFNEFNDVRQFDIFCEEAIITGSRIPERRCAPRYMKQAYSDTVQKFLFSDLRGPKPDGANGGVSMNTVGAQGQTQEQLWLYNNPKHREFNDKFRELAAQHPELNATLLDWQAKQRVLEDLEAQQKDASALGRFFGKFGSKEGN